MKTVSCVAAAAALTVVAMPALAAPVVDGMFNAGEYGAGVSVATSATADEHNFGAPGGSARAGYDIYLTTANDTLFGAIVQTGGTTAGAFANLYFDVDPVTGTNGSDFGIEVTNNRGFVPGVSGYFAVPGLTSATTTNGGLTTLEFSVANSSFRAFIAGGRAQGFFSGYTPQNVRLNLSQSLSYSVAGGQDNFGTQRLGTFNIAAAVPEPTTWGMMILGMGAVGFGLRSRRKGAATKVRFA